MAVPAVPVERLQRALRGPVLAPGDPGYDVARATFNGTAGAWAGRTNCITEIRSANSPMDGQNFFQATDAVAWLPIGTSSEFTQDVTFTVKQWQSWRPNYGFILKGGMEEPIVSNDGCYTKFADVWVDVESFDTSF